MNMFRSRAATSMTALAAFAMSATPVLAHGYGGWGRHYHRHGDGIDGGDVLAGLLIVGGIAAIASAARKSAKEIGRAHVCTPVTNAHLVCRLLLEKKKHINDIA